MLGFDPLFSSISPALPYRQGKNLSCYEPRRVALVICKDVEIQCTQLSLADARCILELGSKQGSLVAQQIVEAVVSQS